MERREAALPSVVTVVSFTTLAIATQLKLQLFRLHLFASHCANHCIISRSCHCNAWSHRTAFLLLLSIDKRRHWLSNNTFCPTFYGPFLFFTLFTLIDIPLRGSSRPSTPCCALVRCSAHRRRCLFRSLCSSLGSFPPSASPSLCTRQQWPTVPRRRLHRTRPPAPLPAAPSRPAQRPPCPRRMGRRQRWPRRTRSTKAAMQRRRGGASTRPLRCTRRPLSSSTSFALAPALLQWRATTTSCSRRGETRETCGNARFVLYVGGQPHGSAGHASDGTRVLRSACASVR